MLFSSRYDLQHFYWGRKFNFHSNLEPVGLSWTFLKQSRRASWNLVAFKVGLKRVHFKIWTFSWLRKQYYQRQRGKIKKKKSTLIGATVEYLSLLLYFIATWKTRKHYVYFHSAHEFIRFAVILSLTFLKELSLKTYLDFSLAKFSNLF